MQHALTYVRFTAVAARFGFAARPRIDPCRPTFTGVEAQSLTRGYRESWVVDYSAASAATTGASTASRAATDTARKMEIL